MSNSILTSTVAVPFLVELEASMPVLANGNVTFNKEFVGGTGTSINVLKPEYGNAVATSADLTSALSDVKNATVSIDLTTYAKGCALSLVEQALKISNMKDQVDVPMSSKMASDIQILAWTDLWLSAGNVSVVTTGSGAVTYTNVSTGIAKLNSARSMGEKIGVMGPDLATAVMSSGDNLFNADVSGAWLNGTLGKYRGVKFFESQDCAGTLVIGAQTRNTVAVNQPSAYVAGATTLAIDATGLVGDFKKGQAFTVAGVYSVDVFGNATGNLYPFILQADVTASGNAMNATIKGVYATGANKNVSALPADDAVVTFLQPASKTFQSVVMWDKQGFAVASAKVAPSDDAKETVSVNGKILNLTMSRGGNFLKSENYIRWDVLMGWKVLYQSLVSRVDVQMD